MLGQAREGREDGRHAALGVARAAAIKPSLSLLRLERRDGHPVDRHRILMGIQQNHAAVLRRTVTVQAGDQILVAGRHQLPLGRQTDLPAGCFQEAGQPGGAVDRAGHVSTHRIDAGDGHQLFQYFQGIEDHDFSHSSRCSATN